MNKFVFLFALIFLTACGDQYAADQPGTCNFDLTSTAQNDDAASNIEISRTFERENEDQCLSRCIQILKRTRTSSGSKITWECKFQDKVIQKKTPNVPAPANQSSSNTKDEQT